jgi:hypothetical protein
MQGGQRRGAATSRHVQATVTRSEAALAPRRIQALVGQRRCNVPGAPQLARMAPFATRPERRRDARPKNRQSMPDRTSGSRRSQLRAAR